MLRTVVLALNNNARRFVGNAYCGIRSIDMLTSGTAGPIGIDPQIGGIDLDLDVLVDLR